MVLDCDRLNPVFAQEFDAGGLAWLVPLLVRLRAGDDVTQEIIDGYRVEHGRYPAELY